MTASSLLAASADLTLTLKGAPSPVVVGGNLTLSYAITNKGPDTATTLLLTNRLPPSVIVKSAVVTNGTYTIASGVFSWSFDSLDSNAWATAQLIVAPVNTQTITNRAGVIAATPDPASNNNLNRGVNITVKPLAAGANLQVPRAQHTATVLADGKVLLTGGYNSSGLVTTRTAETYDPTTETFTSTGDMSVPRKKHTATLLPDGSVLVVGGDTGSGPTAAVTNAIDLYFPTNGIFVATNALARPRVGHTATLLPDGRILIAGGAGTNVVEFYNCADGTVSPGGSLVMERSGHYAALMPNGKVLFVGGAGFTAEVFDPQTGVSHAVANLETNFTTVVATAMLSGKVLVYGRTGAEVFDPDTEQFSLTGPPLSGRSNPRLTLLSDGRVLLSGGIDGMGYVASTEIYDPAANAFNAGSPMTVARLWHTATLLQDSRVLIAGGANSSVLSTSEIYGLIVDMDHDGMDDNWELRYGFDPTDRNDAIQDADADGLNNLQEYLAGTDPRDPDSVMHIDTCQISASTFRVRFNSVLGKSYRVERTTNLYSGVWDVVSNNIWGTGAIVEIADALMPGSTPRFYRVRLLQ